MIAYGFDQDGFYTGQVKRQPSPLEPGVWLLPAQSTDVPPPEVPTGYRAKWSGKWEVVEEVVVVIQPETPVEEPGDGL